MSENSSGGEREGKGRKTAALQEEKSVNTKPTK